MPLSLFFIALIAFGNLRGVRESGRIFAAPTFFFMANMGVLLGPGASSRYLTGDLPVRRRHVPGHGRVRRRGHGPAAAASAFVLAKAFASGGAAVTGVEAISNGVPAFRKPEWRNARQTLVVMGSGLAVMFLGPVVPGLEDRGRPVRGRARPRCWPRSARPSTATAASGETMSNVLNVATMLILVLAANTGFADFPRLANLQAGDNFLPRQLTKRGHRLVFSNGIIALAGAAAVLVVAHRRRGRPA